MPTTLAQRLRQDPLKYVRLALTAPVIYGLGVVIVAADLCATVYQQSCFRVYGIPRVRRGDYVVMDRGRLKYLSLFDKINCVYCEYANGVIGYVAEIVARTEWYWCPIKHGRAVTEPHAHYDKFLDYGDGANFRARLRVLRQQCRACETGCGDKPED